MRSLEINTQWNASRYSKINFFLFGRKVKKKKKNLKKYSWLQKKLSDNNKKNMDETVKNAMLA